MKTRLIKPIVFCLLVCNCHKLYSQEISGVVYNDSSKLISQITVSLLNAGDSSLVKADLTDQRGAYEFRKLKTGRYIMVYSGVGFETHFSSQFSIADTQIVHADPVYLKIAAKQLQAVSIHSKKGLIQVSAGKTVFNVQNSINATGSNALELLQKSPGVSIDNNENISMKGKAGVRIYVDGKMLQLNNEDLAAYLKSINSNDVESIEFITSPGAKYDASGNAGIINFRLRKNVNFGTNGSISAGIIQGVTPKGTSALSLNYRNKLINVFGNASGNIGRYETLITAPRIQKDTLYDQHLRQLSNAKSLNFKAGIDLFIGKKQTIGLMNTTSLSKEDWGSYGNTEISYQPSNRYVKQLVALNEMPRERTSSNTNINYRYAEANGTEINFDGDYGFYRGRANSYQPNEYIAFDNTVLSQIITYNNTPTDIDIYTAKVDIRLPAWKGKLAFGAKFSDVKTANTLDFYNDNNGNKVKVDDRSYNFVYKENVNAAYVTFQRQLSPKWNIEAGLRMEQTNSHGILNRADGNNQADNDIKRDYLDLFPNVIVTYTANKANTFNLSYGRRIDRPGYQSLNPFELKLDELSYVKGNAFLRPQYTDNIELTYTFNNKINISIGYSNIKDVATQTVDSLNNYTYAFARNIASQKIGSFSISTPLTFTKWWGGFINLWANYQKFEGMANDHVVDIELGAFGAFIQNSFQFGKDYSAELSGWFNGPSALTATLKAKSMGGIDLGFQKLVLKKRGTIRLTGTDIFRTAIPFRAKTDFGGVHLQFWVRRESQTIRLNFSYRFGNNKVKASRNRQTGLESETKRIKES